MGPPGPKGDPGANGMKSNAADRPSTAAIAYLRPQCFQQTRVPAGVESTQVRPSPRSEQIDAAAHRVERVSGKVARVEVLRGCLHIWQHCV